MRALQPVSDINFGHSGAVLLAAEFSRRAAAADAIIYRNDNWPLDIMAIGRPDVALARLPLGSRVCLVTLGARGHLAGTSVFYEQTLATGAVAYVFLQFNLFDVAVTTAAASVLDTLAAQTLLEQAFPRFDPPVVEERPTAPVRFWMLTNSGPSSTTRHLDVVSWEMVRGNYPRATGEGVRALAQDFRPRRSGQLLLFHGPPGTGKTFAIRTLAWEWRSWCSVHYIMDVPTFLTGPPSYLTTLLFENDAAEPVSLGQLFHVSPDEMPPDEAEQKLSPPPQNRHWRLIVLEDSGELLAEDAKTQAGAGLARLLNAADGLLGQGARVMFLITTNERLDALHPAVKRPGRCAANLEFQRFERIEADQWLQANGAPADLTAPPAGGTLAELYELLEAKQQIVAAAKRGGALGFAA